MGSRSAPVAPPSFSLVLPSNASPSVYPNNTPSNFSVKLNPSIELQGAYECALDEIILPRSWINLDSDDLYLYLINTHTSRSQKVQLDPGHYGTVNYLVSAINNAIKPEFKFFGKSSPNLPKIFPENLPAVLKKELLVYRREYHKVFLSLPTPIKLSLSPRLAKLLGFVGEAYEGPYFAFADHTPDVNAELGELYVYLSILHNRVVGDTQVPLLRIIPLHSTRGEENLFYSFQRLQFVPIKVNNFDHISVNIRDGRGQLIPFQKGNTVATLQLRRKLPF